MKTLSKSIFGLMVLAGAAAVMAWPFLQARGDEEDEEAERVITSPAHVLRTADGRTIVELSQETAHRNGIQIQPLATTSAPSELIAYGTLREDPAQTFTLRAPITGTLLASGECAWPSLGEELRIGACVGVIEPLYAPAEHIDLESRLASAQADVQANTASLAADRAAYERAKLLYARKEIVSEQTMQEAQAKMQGDEARLAAARKTVKILESALAARTPAASTARLAIKAGGRVVNVGASVGETVKSGQELLRVVQFNTMLAVVALPAGANLSAPIRSARMIVLGHEDHPLQGTLVGPTPSVDQATLGQTFLFRVNADGLELQAGAAVTACLALSAAPQTGVIIPRSAVVWMEGKPWAYVQSPSGRFTRHVMAAPRLLSEGWLTPSSFAAGQLVVVTGAQQLLSAESGPATSSSD